MANLLTLQKKFLEGFEGDSSFEKSIKKSGASPHQRLSVYYNNITQALRHALQAIYPLTWKLIGEDCANGAAFAFVKERKFLPRTGVLDEWGEDFPDFLRSFPPTQSLGYLPDFARLEWLQHVAYGEEDKLPLSPNDFIGIEEEKFEKLFLTLHPSAQLLSSIYPLDQVMEVVEGRAESVKLDERGARALVIRPYQQVNLHWISESSFTFFSEIQKGSSLVSVLEDMKEESFDFHKVLSFALQYGVFSEYSFQD